MPTVYEKALPADMPELLDHANYVFSAAHCPHNFRTLLPKVYGEDAPYEAAEQYVARKDGKIVALVANRPMTLCAGGQTLKVGFVGTVSVHPYCRGEGHMKHLMPLMHNKAVEMGMDVLVLGGQRQRYQYFGFENGGLRTAYTITATNVRHALPDVDDSTVTLLDIDRADAALVDRAWAMHQAQPVHIARSREEFIPVVHSWDCRCDIILWDGEMIGYAAGNGNEIILTDEALLPLAIKALLRLKGLKEITVSVSPWQTERSEILGALCEHCRISTADMLCVLNWQRVLTAALHMRAMYAPLADGVCVLDIDGQTLRISVANGQIDVSPCADAPQLTLTALKAQALFFGEGQLLAPNPRLHGWLPLPLDIPTQDCF